MVNPELGLNVVPIAGDPSSLFEALSRGMYARIDEADSLREFKVD